MVTRIRPEHVRLSAWLAALSVLATACGSDETPRLTQSTVPGAVPDLAAATTDVAGDDSVNPADSTVDPDGVVPPDTDVPPLGLDDNALCSRDIDCNSGLCWWRADGRRCAPACDGELCPEGLVCVTASEQRACADPFVAQCAPCDTDADCRAGSAAGFAGGTEQTRCVDFGRVEGRFCAVSCGDDLTGGCPEGTACERGLCRPDNVSSSCICSVFAVEMAAATPCVNANPNGACDGRRTCNAVGQAPSGCDAPAAGTETCNGRDDNCDGRVDERPLTPDCGPFACAGVAGCLDTCGADDDCAPGRVCIVNPATGAAVCGTTGDDGAACATPEECDSGFCSNDYCCNPEAAGREGDVLCCSEDVDCEVLEGHGECVDASSAGCSGVRTIGRCVDSFCETELVPDTEVCAGTLCADATCEAGPTWRSAGTCDANGQCLAGDVDVCDDANICTTNGCESNDGCSFPVADGPTSIACYSFDAATRGIGTCRDGTRICSGGALDACVGDIGPVAEICNGLNDDCDGLVDEDTEASCFPYLCGATAGCLTRCESDAQCAAGNFCNNGGRCVPTGEDGSTCANNRQCLSGYCNQGTCCSGGTCCRGATDCRGLDALTCEDRSLAGCLGFKAVGRCDPDFVCRTDVAAAPDACIGQGCHDRGVCQADGLLGSGFKCGSTGSCDAAVRTDCSPYLCQNGACPTRCAGDSECVNGSRCVNGVCSLLPDGVDCSVGNQCQSGWCSQGICCADGLCCRDAAGCSALDGSPVCTAAATCTGQKPVGRCGADFRCQVERVAWPAACEAQRCGQAVCVNLSGGGFVLEGVSRPTCSATGSCDDIVRDCGQFATGSYCDFSGRGIYGSCSNCTSARNTCVAAGLNCRCE